MEYDGSINKDISVSDSSPGVATNSEIKELSDKIDCLQRSQVYIHNHISKVEKSIDELKTLILCRLTDAESYDLLMAEVN